MELAIADAQRGNFIIIHVNAVVLMEDAKKINWAVEINILVALFKAATEQSRMLNGAFKHRKKQQFNHMQQACEHWLKTMEMTSNQTPGEQEFTDNITDAIHEVCGYLRKEMTEIILKNEKGQDSTTSN